MSRGPDTVFSPDLIAQRWREFPAMASASRLCAVVLVALVLWSVDRSQAAVWAVVALFAVASLFNMWRVTTGRDIVQARLPYYWLSAAFALIIAWGTEGGVLLLVLLLYPLSMCTAVHGLRRGLTLGACCAAAWLAGAELAVQGPRAAVPAVAMLLLPLIMTLVARPLATLRQRMQLVEHLEQVLDPRRGLVAAGLMVGERLRAATGARRVLVCHRDAEVPTVLVCDVEDGAFVPSAALGGRVLAQLAGLPGAAVEYRAHGGLRAGGAARARPAAGVQQAVEPLQALAQLLEADLLQLVPDAPDQASTGWMLVVYGAEKDTHGASWPLPLLAGFATDMRRTLQQASTMDRLQDEIAAHERARIGRDLHDSAIQPYLGLKFAIEGLALRSDPANPMHAPIQELRAVCDAELVELRKTVSALRAGDTSGENSLAMALQRQCSRFARLFDIQVDLQVPPDLPASRHLISALLHMVNEALNNVRRHTEARQVWIRLEALPGAVQLTVRDDAGQRMRAPAPAFEPRSLTERAHELGGTLVRRLHEGLDTEICITLPT